MEYKGFYYWLDRSSAKWKFRFPSGVTGTLSFDDEAAVKLHIDTLEAEYSSK